MPLILTARHYDLSLGSENNMKVTIFGTGTWGTGLAQVLSDNGHHVLMYGIEKTQVDDINNNHKNSFFFGDEVILHPNIKATLSLDEAINYGDIFLLSVPSFAMRSLLHEISLKLQKKALFINTAKGFDLEKEERLSDLIREEIPSHLLKGVVSLIGPSHAEEVVIRLLTVVTATSLDLKAATLVQELFSNEYFRVYTQSDEIGAELGVAYKNAIAIASGILAGLGYGDNARAALITRGLAEMVRFGMYYGAELETYLGLTGLGDLIVTCNSLHSRNFQAGFAIGKANDAKEFLENNKKTVEGIRTTKIIHLLSLQNGLELPIVSGIYSVLYEGALPSKVVKNLMLRPLRSEKM